MNTQENQENYIIRCPECILIPSIRMKFESNEIEYECENKIVNLPKFSSQKIELYLQVFKEGKINIKGVEFTMGGCAVVKHYFNKKNKSKLYRHPKNRRRSSISTANTSRRKMSTSSQNSSNSKGSSRNSYQLHINYKEDIICDIVDNNHDINIIFPLGKEIQLYKDQFFLMPIKIVNNSDIKIKRFCWKMVIIFVKYFISIKSNFFP